MDKHCPILTCLYRIAPPQTSGFDRTLAEVEAEYIKNVLASVGGNRTHTAQILGIDRKTLREKLARYERVTQES